MTCCLGMVMSCACNLKYRNHLTKFCIILSYALTHCLSAQKKYFVLNENFLLNVLQVKEQVDMDLLRTRIQRFLGWYKKLV